MHFRACFVDDEAEQAIGVFGERHLFLVSDQTFGEVDAVELLHECVVPSSFEPPVSVREIAIAVDLRQFHKKA